MQPQQNIVLDKCKWIPQNTHVDKNVCIYIYLHCLEQIWDLIIIVQYILVGRCHSIQT